MTSLLTTAAAREHRLDLLAEADARRRAALVPARSRRGRDLRSPRHRWWQRPGTLRPAV
jgi:hypothetical protein